MAPFCRFCFGTAEAGRELVSPCRCRGTSKHVHKDCLNRWRLASACPETCSVCLGAYSCDVPRASLACSPVTALFTSTLLGRRLALAGRFAPPWLRSAADKVHVVVWWGICIYICYLLFLAHYSLELERQTRPASTVSLLLSNFVGSATMKNLGRLQGVAMGTAVGQLAYTTLAWCSLPGHAAVVSFLFCWEMGTLYLYYSSAELGYMGCLLAAFGAQNLLQGCSSTDIFHPTALAHKVIDCVLGITVMTVVDLLLAPSDASVLAYRGYMDFWRDCRYALAEALDPEVENVRMRSGGLLRQLVQVEALGQEADKEPRFWRTPWKSSLWEEAIQSGYNMRLFLTSVEGAMAERGKNGGPKAKGMLRLIASPEFANVREDVLAKLAALEGLLEALSWTKETDWYQVADPEKAVEDKEPGRAGMFVDTRPSERKHLARLAARLQSSVEEEASDAAAAGGGEGEAASKSLDDDLRCKACSAASALQLQLAQLDRLKHKLLTL